MGRFFGVAGALFGLSGVALGAFGAHALRARLSPADLAVFEAAVRYQLFHALALVLVAILAERNQSRALQTAGWGFLVGIGVFAGSLYILTLAGQRWLGAVTPVGGVAFLVGWGAFAWGFLRKEGS